MSRVCRGKLIDQDNAGVYHCIHRCARRARLCGKNPLTGLDCSHRKRWLENRMEFLARWFCIDVLQYCILENHFHIMLRNRPDILKRMNNRRVAKHWCMLCPRRGWKQSDGPYVPKEDEIRKIVNNQGTLKKIRSRLSDISWFFKKLVEPLSRWANIEDGCRGHFWEDRFRSIRLNDQAAVTACAAYIDLNPIRAGLAKCLDDSAHTSIKARLNALKEQEADASAIESILTDHWISPLTMIGDDLTVGEISDEDRPRCSDNGFLPMSFKQYVELLEWTAIHPHANSDCTMPPHLAGTLERLGIEKAQDWITLAWGFSRCFSVVAGSESARQREAERMQLDGLRPMKRQLIADRPAASQLSKV